MRLFVTGGAGFIGSNFIRYWLQTHPDDSIVNFDALTYAGTLTSLKDLDSDPRYYFVRGDVVVPEQVENALEGCQVVVHFAAESHVDRSVTAPAAFVQTNVVGTQVLLDAARRIGISHFHHISTDEVFGSLPLNPTQKFTEQTPYNPHSPYSASKASSDMLVRAYHDTYGLPITISNCSNNYGPYQFPEKLIPLMTIKALADENLPIYGTGENIRDWIHVTDHNRAVGLILEKGEIGQSYCIGGQSERTNLQMVKSILAILDKPESLITYVTDRPGHDLRYAIDDSKIEQELGFERQFSFEDGLEATIRWYQANEGWWRPLL